MALYAHDTFLRNKPFFFARFLPISVCFCLPLLQYEPHPCLREYAPWLIKSLLINKIIINFINKIWPTC